MREYYFYDGKQQRGPYSLDELKPYINPNTPIWHEGLDAWTEARNVLDIKSVPPPFIRANPAPINEPPKEEEEWWAEKHSYQAMALVFIAIMIMAPGTVGIALVITGVVLFLINKFFKTLLVLFVILLIIAMGFIIYMQNSTIENHIKYQYVKHNYTR